MYKYICEKCNKIFQTRKRGQRFCSKSCSNSVNTSQRKIEDKSIYSNGLNAVNSYILGLIYSDGCLSFDKHTHRYRITVSMNDYELIKKLKDIMTPCKSIYKYKHPKGTEYTYSVVSTNPYDIDFLKSCGIIERKSKTISFPNLPVGFISHFIRGYFDGDGSVFKSTTNTYYKNNIRQYTYTFVRFTTGSIKFAYQLRCIFKKYGIKATVVKDCRKNYHCWYVNIYKKKDVTIFYKEIYKDAELFLNRKHFLFTEMI
ncbi:MAG: LAGLIDADG family homing endonuclease [Bacillota bacterium]|nr:LAGLIDADG family homing endonuclease [Bacillota bacterium]